MNPHNRFVSILGVTALFGALTALVAVPASADSKCWSYNHYELKFAQLINRARTPVGGLILDPELSKVAKRHTKWMVARSHMRHSTIPQLRRRVTGWTMIGENIGGPGRSVINFHRAFMHSPHHRLNIMDPGFRYMGIGVIVDRAGMWVTQTFTAPGNPGTPLRMPSCHPVSRPKARRAPKPPVRPGPSGPGLISSITSGLLTGLIGLMTR